MSKERTTKKGAEALKVGAKPERRLLFFRITLLLAIFSFYGFYLAQPINLTAADLGRHLKNGEIFFQNLSVPKSNLYSYTHPDYPFINHHWASGVVFYVIERVAGFSGLSLFFIVLSLATLSLMFFLAVRCSSFEVAALLALIMIPVLMSRYRIRPELFSYFLGACFLYLLWNHRDGRLRLRWLLLLPLLQVLWVNLHIYFFVGPGLITIFLIEALSIWLKSKDEPAKRAVKELVLVLFLVILASCVNPFGLKGTLYPLTISQAYGYPVFENRSAWSVLNRDINFPPLTYFQIAFAVLCLSWLYVLLRQPSRIRLANVILTLVFSASAWLSIRNFAIFGYFALPLAAANFPAFVASSASRKRKAMFLGVFMGVFLSLILVSPVYFLSAERGRRGLGLEKGTEGAAEFFKRENLQGPIFNNYDVGSYLIYYLYPRPRVFVDNRPEAYPEEFFRDLYIPIQANETEWQSASAVYNFNVIFFHHRDLTPWGQPFVVRRVLDPLWAPVYFDKEVIILLRRYGVNQSAVKKYEIPKEKVLETTD